MRHLDLSLAVAAPRFRPAPFAGALLAAFTPFAAPAVLASAVGPAIPPAEVFPSWPLGYAVLLDETRQVSLLEVSPDIRVLWTFEAPFKPIEVLAAPGGSRVALVNDLAAAARNPGAPAVLLLDRRGRPGQSVSFARLFDRNSFPVLPEGLFWLDDMEFDDEEEVLLMTIVPPRADWDACLADLDPGDREEPYGCMDEDHEMEIDLDCDTGGILLQDDGSDNGAGEDEDETD